MTTGDLVLLTQATDDEGSWRVSAACTDASTASFFEPQETDTPRSWADVADSGALSLCGRCPVRRDCLTHALRTPEPFGIWGGTTPVERERILLGLAG